MKNLLKWAVAFFLGAAVVVVGLWSAADKLMFTEIESPFGVEETVARIQQNVQKAGNGWSLSGLRNAAKPIENDGGNTLPVMMIEACTTKYSGPILKNDATRVLSILMPCKITVFKKSNGKVYIGLMNARLIGSLFGSEVAALMEGVAADQAKFIVFDPSKPAPAIITAPAGGGSGSGGAGSGAAGGC
jgi:uncharacterized protein (DUF302 family)